MYGNKNFPGVDTAECGPRFKGKGTGRKKEKKGSKDWLGKDDGGEGGKKKMVIVHLPVAVVSGGFSERERRSANPSDWIQVQILHKCIISFHFCIKC